MADYPPEELDRIGDVLEGSDDERVCGGCDCTDESPCEDEATGAPCYWVTPDLCSVCARSLLAMCDAGQLHTGRDEEFRREIRELLGRGDREILALDAGRRVDVFSPHEAQRWIEARRAGGGSC